MNYVKEFLADMGALSAVTRKKYEEHIERFIDYANATGENTRHVTPADLYRYREFLISSELSANSVYGYLFAVRRFYSWMHEMGYMETNITHRLNIPKRENLYTRGHLTVDQARDLIRTMPQDSLIEKRNYTMVCLMLIAGLRCVEISRLNICNIKAENGIYFIEIIRKGHLFTERLGINKRMWDQLHAYLAARDDDRGDKSPAFVTHQKKRNARLTPDRVGRIIRSILISSGLKTEEITAHSLRHTAAVTALDMGVQIYDIKVLLGHSSVKITEMYQRSRDAERLLENPISDQISALLFGDEKPAKNE